LDQQIQEPAMASHFYELTVGILVVWRFAHLLYAEDGPWGSMVRLRRAAGEGFWASLLDCFCCLSLWLALPFADILPLLRHEQDTTEDRKPPPAGC
jgi:hypothetical protein